MCLIISYIEALLFCLNDAGRNTRLSDSTGLTVNNIPTLIHCLSMVDIIFLFQLHSLRHNNLATFVGACIDPGQFAVVSEYCPRGSLEVNMYLNICVFCLLMNKKKSFNNIFYDNWHLLSGR
ncbi:hypothetical protein KUTeg_020615 [Tegillarca granosa]|uniref:Serine-threonine/tyrosine-protein kinase catalytic domain-containing protein n=1 Tax=Tegillarca granosa TaxID=220873 RepID=A0ABQ9E8E7_TEGGR|nr:hypothetical protein KUTeg_020615 [Tegillarca granosa]